jgi:hypothetical protein
MPGQQQIEEVTARDDVDYGSLRLRANPFVFAEVVQGGRDAVDSHLAGLCAAELERLWRDVVTGNPEHPIVWFAPGPEETIRAEILMVAALMRRLTIDPEVRLLPTYLNVELAYMDFVRGISNALGDRLIPREFRRCLYALVLAAFEDVVAGKAEAGELEGLPVADYVEMLSQGREGEFSKALFPQAPPTEDPEEAKQRLQALGPEEAAEELARQQARQERWVAEKEVRRRLRAFIDRLVDGSELGPAVTAAAHEGLARGFSATEPFMVTSDLDGPFRQNVMGMMRFARNVYERCAFLIDQLDSVVEFTSEEQESLVAGMAELGITAGRQALWLMRGPHHVYEALRLEEKGFVTYRETAAIVPARVMEAGRPDSGDIRELARRFVAYQHEDPEAVLSDAVIDHAIEMTDDTLGALRALGIASRKAAIRGGASVQIEDLG